MILKKTSNSNKASKTATCAFSEESSNYLLLIYRGIVWRYGDMKTASQENAMIDFSYLDVASCMHETFVVHQLLGGVLCSRALGGFKDSLISAPSFGSP